MQHIFYRNAKLIIQADNKDVEICWEKADKWKKTGNTYTLTFPVDDKMYMARWESISDKPTNLTLTFQQGKQQRQKEKQQPNLILTYPPGALYEQED